MADEEAIELARVQVRQLEKLHRDDYVVEDSTHQALRDHLRGFSELALRGSFAFEALAERTKFAEEVRSILENHPSQEVLGDALAVICDFTEFEEELAEETDDENARTRCLKLINRLMDIDLSRVVVELLKNPNASGEIRVDCFRFLTNLCELYPTAGPEHLVERTEALEVLLSQSSVSIGSKTATTVDVTEPSTASELLSIILDASDAGRHRVAETRDLLDLLVRGVSNWKSLEPGFAEEEEWRETLHACLRRIVEDSTAGRRNFRECEGIELLVKMLSVRLGKSHGVTEESATDGMSLALQMLKVAIDNDLENCRNFVDCGGLKYVFPIWMDAHLRKEKKPKLDEPLLLLGSVKLAFEVIFILFLWLEPSDTHFARVRAKFSSDLQKVERVVGYHNVYAGLVASRVQELEEQEEFEPADEEADLMEHGLKELQQVDVVLCRLLGQNEADTLAVQVPRLLAAAAGVDESTAIDEIRRVVADFAESGIVLEGIETNELQTAALRKKLVQIALF